LLLGVSISQSQMKRIRERLMHADEPGSSQNTGAPAAA
jgi:hypothetical protein